MSDRSRRGGAHRAGRPVEHPAFRSGGVDVRPTSHAGRHTRTHADDAWDRTWSAPEPELDQPELDQPDPDRPDLDEPDWFEDDRPRRRRGLVGFLGRHRALSALGVAFLLLLGVVASGAWYLNHQIDAIPRIELDVPGQRPPAPTNRSMNILLAGADDGDDGDSIAAMVASGTWKPGAHRSDTIMVLHLTADRKHAYLVSIPRDTYVTVSGYGMQKINAAFSYGGPALYVRTVEQFTQLRMQHLAIIDWNGFRDLADALGGVRVYVAKSTADYHQGEWKQGWTTLRGDRALRYVRTRYGLANGDYDRIQRQQNFLRAALSQAKEKGNLANPVRFTNMIQAITRNLTVDSGLSSSQIRSLAWSLRHLGASDITYVTAPMARFESNSAGSVIIPDLARTKELFSDVATDDLDEYVAKYGSEARTLGAPDQID